MRNVSLKNIMLGVMLGLLVLGGGAAYAGRTDLWSAGTDAVGDYWVVRSNGQMAPGGAGYSAVAMSTNTSLNVTGTAPNYVYLGAMTGNHTFVLPTVATAGARAHIRLIAAANTIGTTGNLTLSVGNDGVSVGNINGIDTLTVTNTSGATGAVSFIDCYASPNVTSNDWFVGVVRR